MKKDLESKLNRNMTIWSSKEECATDLVKRLEKEGYKVKSYGSGSTKPVAEYGGNLYSGYKRIMTTFLRK